MHVHAHVHGGAARIARTFVRVRPKVAAKIKMERQVFRKLFKCSGPAILPVIHVLDFEQTQRNVQIALGEGVQGVFLINHDFSYDRLLPILKRVREKFPYLWMGVNFLGVTGEEAFPVLSQLSAEGTQVDAYWADSACVNERASLQEQVTANRIRNARDGGSWKGLYFGGVAFKGQRHVPDSDLGKAASIATHYMDVVTTSGRATGVAASTKKIEDMRAGCGNVAMALASGITPSNAADYLLLVDCFMVATGISPPGDFYNFDPVQLRVLVQSTRGHGKPPSDPWYLSLIAPNTKGEKYAWLDPTSIYLNATAFAELTHSLLSQLSPQDFDLVAGIDAMGFPLAAAIALRVGKGFLAIRKAGHLCVETDKVEYECYSGPGKEMEMRKNALSPGTRVLIVDQWMETGGTMEAAVRLVEGQGGVVAALATICAETRPLTKELSKRYRLVHVVPPHLQPQFDTHTFLGAGMKSSGTN